ncbi:unnamed protein product [Arabis nemorensis]|uniref:Uncharacterized protein n=1 Tax=Arabis nemorensis TaxID=586526 RepID=A0A565BJ09_9BRAS|nr:unnamed protein product [Arabis nemorensis]
MSERIELLLRMFAVGEEPVGIRVTLYGPSNGIRSIMNALEEDERDLIWELIDIRQVHFHRGTTFLLREIWPIHNVPTA